MPKPSAEPTPRPPLTTTLASASETPLATASTCSATCTTRSAGSSAGANVSIAGAPAPLTAAAGDGVRRDGEQRRRAVDARLLEQAAAPADARHVERRSGVAADAVTFAANGRSRRAATCAITSLPRFVPAATTALGSSRSISSSTQRAHAAGAYAASRSCSATYAVVTPCAPSCAAALAAADEQRRRLAEVARQRERLQRQLVDVAAVVLDEDQHAHHATPSSRMTSTTAGAASGPRPRISACLPWPAGTTSRRRSSCESGRAGVRRSIGFWRARSFAGTDG